MKSGNIHIIETPDKFKRVPKAIIYDEAVDVISLGIYVKILGLGEKWDLNVPGLAKALHVSEPKIKTALSILERSGYVKRIHVKNASGHFTGYDYHIASTPFPVEERTDLVATNGPKKPAHQLPQNPAAGKSSRWENQPLENRGDINIDYKENRDYNCKTKTQDFTPPTVSEVADYVRSRGWSDPEGFAKYYVSYHTESKWHMINGKPIRNWKLNVVAWEPNNKNRYFSSPSFTPTPKAPAPAMQEVTFEELTKI